METGNAVMHSPPGKFRWKVLLLVLGAVLVSVMLVSAFVLVSYIAHRVTRPASLPRVRAINEVGMLNCAVEAFRERFGTYPPRGDPKEIERGVAIMFPRWQDYRGDFKAAGLDLAKLNDNRALVFWLGGMRRKPGSTELMGFCADPVHPLGDNPARIGPFYDFDQKRLVETQGGWLEYLVEAPPDWKPKPVQYDGKKVFLPGLEPIGPQR